MEEKIIKRINRIEFITRYVIWFIAIILVYIRDITQNDVFYAIAFTLCVCEIINMIILFLIQQKVRDVFFEEILKRIDEGE